jgi:hypothetical protein
MKKFEKIKNIEDLVKKNEKYEKNDENFFIFHFMFF